MTLSSDEESQNEAPSEARYWIVKREFMDNILKPKKFIKEDVIRMMTHLFQDYVSHPSTSLNPTRTAVSDTNIGNMIMIRDWDQSKRQFLPYSNQSNNRWTSRANNPIPLDTEWIFLPIPLDYHWSLLIRHRYKRGSNFHHKFYYIDGIFDSAFVLKDVDAELLGLGCSDDCVYQKY